MKKMLIGFFVGCFVMVSGTVLADSVKQYMLTEAEYAIVVNGQLYENADAPILNYEGTTYVPLRAVGQLLNTKVAWNAAQFRVEIGETQTGTEPLPQNEDVWAEVLAENDVFRNIRVKGSNGQYQITGEAKPSNQVFYYSVSDGHFYLLDRQYKVSNDNEWHTFEIHIDLSEDVLPWNGTLMLELYDGLDDIGFRTHMLFVPLERFVS